MQCTATGNSSFVRQKFRPVTVQIPENSRCQSGMKGFEYLK